MGQKWVDAVDAHQQIIHMVNLSPVSSTSQNLVNEQIIELCQLCGRCCVICIKVSLFVVFVYCL